MSYLAAMPRRRFQLAVASVACLGLVTVNSASLAIAAPNKPIATIDVGGGSFTGTVSADGETVFVPVDMRNATNDSVEGHVAFIDANTNTVKAKIGVGIGPIRITPDTSGGRLYVTNALSGNVSVINVANKRVSATIDVGGQPIYSAFIPGRSRLLVGTGPTGQVAVIDTRSNTVIDRLDLGGNVNSIVLSKNGRFAYATNSTLNRLDVIDTKSLQVVAQVPTGAAPNRVVASPNGRLLLISNWEGGSVTVIDGRTFTVLREVSVGGRPLPAVIAPSGTAAWVASADADTATQITLTGIRTNANPVARTVATGDEPWMLLLNATGSTLYVANRQSAGLTVICTKNGRTPTPLNTSHPNRWIAGGMAIYAGGAAAVVDVLQAAPLKRQRCS